MRERRLAALTDAVTDGERVDWRGAGGRLTSSHSRALAAQLRALSQIGDPARRRWGGDAGARIRQPLLLSLVTALAAVIAIVGGVGIVAQAALDGRNLLRLWIVATFGLTGALLTLGSRHRGAAALGGGYCSVAASFAVVGTEPFFQTLPFGWMAPVLDALRPEAFLAAFFWQFARQFPAVPRFSRADRAYAVIFQLSVALGVLLFAANLLPALGGPPALDAWVQPLNRMSDYGKWFWALIGMATLPALAVLPFRARAATAPERRRVAAFLYATAFGLGPVLAAALAEGLFPPFARAMNRPAAAAVMAWLVYPPIIVMPLLTAYAVTVQDVLRMRIVVRQGLRHLLARWLLAGGTAAALVILATYLYGRRAQPMVDVLAAARGQALLAVSAAGVTLMVFRASITRALDRWVAPGADEPAAVLASLSSDLRGCRTAMELAGAFARAAGRSLQTTADVYVAADGGRLAAVADGVAAPPDGSLVPLLAATATGPCVVEPGHAGSYYGLLSAGDRRWIDERRLGVLVPLRDGRASGELAALVGLQSRLSALPFSRSDLQFLATASAAVSLAADAMHRPAARAFPDAQELALQCGGCRRVDPWRPDPGRCACGGAWLAAALPKVLFDRLSLDAFLGAGGMGIVYRATDNVLHRSVAVKTLPTLTAAAAERLILEARAMAALSHPQVAVLYGTETWRGTPVLVMEYLAGGSLAARLAHGPLAPRAAIRMTLALAAALAHAHAAGWYHGDIKPSNIGFTESDAPKFLDFGLSRAWADAGPPSAGTLPYLAPEVLRGAAGGPALDLWALCVVLFESVAGVHPFLDGATTASRAARGLDDARARAHRDRFGDLWTVLDDALAVDAARRPQTATELARRLAPLERSLT